GDETLLAEAEADLVVAVVALDIVEIPLSARLAAQPADAVVLAGPEVADAAMGLVRLPFGRIEPALAVERHEQVVTLLAVARGMALAARQQQADMPELRRQVFQCGHVVL